MSLQDFTFPLCIKFFMTTRSKRAPFSETHALASTSCLTSTSPTVLSSQVVRDYNVTRLEQQNLIYSSKDSQLQLLKQALKVSNKKGVSLASIAPCVPCCPVSSRWEALGDAEKTWRLPGRVGSFGLTVLM